MIYDHVISVRFYSFKMYTLHKRCVQNSDIVKTELFICNIYWGRNSPIVGKSMIERNIFNITRKTHIFQLCF